MTDRLPSCRYHKATGQGVVTLNSKDHCLGEFDSPESRTADDRLIAEWLAHGRRLPHKTRLSDLTVIELCAGYLTFAEAYYSRDSRPTSEYVAMRDVVKVAKSPLMSSVLSL